MSADTAHPARRGACLDWKSGLGLLISAVLLYWVFRGEDPWEILGYIRQADPLLFLVAVFCTTFIFWLRAWRWKVILEPVNAHTTFRSRFAATTIGFMGNNLLPARIGEFMRAYALSRAENVPVVSAFTSLVLERLFDGLFVVAFLFISMGMPGFPGFSMEQGGTITTAARTAGAIVFAAFVILTAMVLWPRPAVRVIEGMASVLPRSLRRPIVDALEAFLSGVGVLRDPLLFLRTLAWTLAVWFVNAAGFWFGFHAFGFDLSFSAALFFQSVIALSVSIPAGPGFFGTYHGAAVLVLATLWGYPEAPAKAFAVGLHLGGFIPVTLLGLYWARRLGLSLKEVEQSEEVVESAVESATGTDPDRPGNAIRRDR